MGLFFFAFLWKKKRLAKETFRFSLKKEKTRKRNLSLFFRKRKGSQNKPHVVHEPSAYFYRGRSVAQEALFIPLSLPL